MKYDKAHTGEKTKEKKKCRSKQVCWFNPPWSDSVVTPVGRMFLDIVSKCFLEGTKLYQYFNRNTLKMSYSTCKNLKAHVSSHNRNILQPNTKQNANCNCRRKEDCPVQGKCQLKEVVYGATVEVQESDVIKKYFGQTMRSFKERLYEHRMAIKSEKSPHATALSNYIWELKKEGKEYTIKWAILSRAQIYKSGSKKCQLCIHEKTEIALCKPSVLLNNRTELLNKCFHKGKLELAKVIPKKKEPPDPGGH